jgi:CheY-like chemotaxis protein
MPHTSNVTVLLVDDDPLWHMVNTRILQNMGFTAIRSVSNGREALALLKKSLTPESGPYVIFTDLEMPVLDGLHFIESFQKAFDPAQYNVSIALLTTSTNAKHIRKARDLGIDHYLSKPLTVEDALPVFNALRPEGNSTVKQRSTFETRMASRLARKF